MKCIGFRNGCTCGDCQRRYFVRCANSCTYGANFVGRQLAEYLKSIATTETR